MKPAACLLFCFSLHAQDLNFLNRNHPMVDAHNCYPYEGQYADRIDRALEAGYPVSIEQDIAWANGQPVVSHTAKTRGDEPALRQYFFERIRPVVEKALAENKKSTWPLIVLHFDFKTLDPRVLQAVWKELGEYEAWITTAPQTSDPHQLAPLDRKPILVITEDADEQEQVFFRDLKPGDRLRVFGSAHTLSLSDKSREERVHLMATLSPDQLLTERPTNYRRWWNNSWYEVEEGGEPRAGDWTRADNDRLKALVDHAHKLGYWIRFYTLDGFTPEQDRGWDQGYNFGSRAAVETRWKASIAAGVNFIATDQYEDLAPFVRKQAP